MKKQPSKRFASEPRKRAEPGIQQSRRHREDISRPCNLDDFEVLGEPYDWSVKHKLTRLVFAVEIDSGDGGETWDWLAVLHHNPKNWKGTAQELDDLARQAINAAIKHDGLPDGMGEAQP
jgi:hypothetical protein